MTSGDRPFDILTNFIRQELPDWGALPGGVPPERPGPDPASPHDPQLASELHGLPTLPYVYAGIAGGHVMSGAHDGKSVFALVLEHREDEPEGDPPRVKLIFSRSGLEALGRMIPRVLGSVEPYPESIPEPGEAYDQ